MPDSLTQSMISTTLGIQSIALCTLTSLGLGIIIAGIHMVKNKYSKGFVVTLALLPAMVQVIIMLVNGNIGTGVAVAGAFGLVRFRSAPGSARDIGSIFFAMAVGLATGMGYLLYALSFVIIIGIIYIALILSPLGTMSPSLRILKITIPENMDYDDLFKDIFEKYAFGTSLNRVKTTGMGSLFELTYELTLRESNESKEFLDQLRCRNGNLSISLSRPQVSESEL